MSDYPRQIRIGSGKLAAMYERRADELILQFDTPDTASTSQVLARFGLQLVEYPELRAASALSPMMRWVRVPAEVRDDLLGFARRLLGEEHLPSRITMAAPVYFAQDGGPASAVAPVPGKVLVRFRDDNVPPDFGPRNQLVEAPESRYLHPFRAFLVPGPEIPGPSPKMPGRREDGAVQSGEPSAAFDVQDKLSAIPEVAVVELDWLIFFSLLLTPNDTYWPKQWGSKRIKMSTAWNIQTGAAGLIIGLPDSGVDLAHPDLSLTPVMTHFNAAEAEAGAPPPYNAAPLPTAPHGTLVAGLAAATLNNAGGVAGVAGGCLILPARVLPNPTPSRHAAAINWCAAHGARVINISWWAPPSSVIGTALDNAWAVDVVLCAAAGNDPPSASVVFPASHPRCIAVGATDRDNRRKSLASPDGEQWASSFGSELAVCAPGVQLWATDIQGPNGWNDNGGGAKTWMGVNYRRCGDAQGDYFSLMGGTSGAVAHVSGLAALLRLKCPRLANQKVRDIIEQTCKKISPGVYAYANVAGRPNGTWHNEVGHGLVDAHAALKRAALQCAPN
jgi:subtilisin family serine protease